MSDQGGTRLAFADALDRVTAALLILFTAVFLLQVLVPPFERFAEEYLVLNVSTFLAKLQLWQAVTSMFLHGNLAHFLTNMIFFWFFGSSLSNAWRRKEFLAFFFACGVAGSLCFYGFNVFRGDGIRGMGASGAIFGLMIAYAMVFGDRVVLAFFLIPMKARYFVAICFGIEILAMLAGTADGVAHVAHLGGAVCGAIYLRIAWKRGISLRRKKRSATSRIGGLEIMEDDDA